MSAWTSTASHRGCLCRRASLSCELWLAHMALQVCTRQRNKNSCMHSFGRAGMERLWTAALLHMPAGGAGSHHSCPGCDWIGAQGCMEQLGGLWPGEELPKHIVTHASQQPVNPQKLAVVQYCMSLRPQADVGGSTQATVASALPTGILLRIIRSACPSAGCSLCGPVCWLCQAACSLADREALPSSASLAP